jgi:hypothetical protein
LVLAHLRRRWSLSGREGFGFLSPSSRAYEVGFDAFVEVKCLFSTVLEAKKRRRTEVTGVTELWTGHGLGTTSASGQWQQLCTAWGARVCIGASGQAPRGAECGKVLCEHRGMSGHMRSDVSGCDRNSLEPLWTVTGRWHCRVWLLCGACLVMASWAGYVHNLHVRLSLAGASSWLMIVGAQ